MSGNGGAAGAKSKKGKGKGCACLQHGRCAIRTLAHTVIPSLSPARTHAHPPVTAPRRTQELSGRIPRALNAEEFAQARSAEIQELRERVEGGRGARQLFQLLPRDMRRRAMSHNAKRLPVRLRLEQAGTHKVEQRDSSDSDGGGDDSKPKSNKCSCFTPHTCMQSHSCRVCACPGGACTSLSAAAMKKNARATRRSRRHRRRTPGGGDAEDVARREESGRRWLETHIWHAKRMHMGKRLSVVLRLRPYARDPYHYSPSLNQPTRRRALWLVSCAATNQQKQACSLPCSRTYMHSARCRLHERH